MKDNYKIEWGETVHGNKRKLHNFISHFDKHIEKRENAIAKAQERKNIAIAQLDYKSAISLKVKQLELELKEIFEKLSEEEGISA